MSNTSNSHNITNVNNVTNTSNINPINPTNPTQDSTTTDLTDGDSWQAINPHPEQVNGVEFYQQGDIIDIAGQNYQLNAINSVSNGQRWLMLHDGLDINQQSKHYQLLGISKTIKTIAGLNYQISFDYGVLRGLSADELSRVQVYVNGQLIGSYHSIFNAHNTSDALTWQYINTHFIATSNETTIKLMLDGVALGDYSAKGRMAMLGNLIILEYLPVRLSSTRGKTYAIAGVFNPLPIVKLTHAGGDGNEAVARQKLIMQGIPMGISISDGTHSFTNHSNESTSLDLTDYDLSKLMIKTKANYTGDIQLNLLASIETSDNNQSMSSYELSVSVVSGQLAVPQQSKPITLATGSNQDLNTSSLSTVVNHQPVLNVSAMTVIPNPIVATRGNSITFAMVEAMSAVQGKDQLLSDEWLARLEQQATEKWLL